MSAAGSTVGGDPTFAILAGVSLAIEQTRYLREAIAAWESPRDLLDRVTSLQSRLRAIEQLGLDIPVEVNPNQEVLPV